MLEALDIAAITFSLSMLGIYHIHLYSSVILLKNSKAQLSKMIDNAHFWAKKHQEKDDAPTVTLAIQTLRNTILVAVFVGGSAITTGLSYTNSFDSSAELNLQIRAIILSTLCICSFLCFVLVIRFSSQLGYLVSTSNIPHEFKKSKKQRKHEKAAVDGATVIEMQAVDAEIGNTAIPHSVVQNESKASLEEANKMIKEEQLRRCTNVAIMNFLMFR